MSGMIVLYAVVGLAVVIGALYWLLMIRTTLEGGFHTTLHERVERVLAPYEGQQVSDAALDAIQREVESAIRDGLVDCGRPDENFRAIVRNDEVLGPVCLVQIPDGTELALSEYERRLLRPSSH